MIIAYRNEDENRDEYGVMDLWDFLDRVLDTENEEFLQDYLCGINEGRGYISLPFLGDVRLYDIYRLFDDDDGHTLSDLQDAILQDEYDYYEGELLYDSSPAYIEGYDVIEITHDEAVRGEQEGEDYIKSLFKEREGKTE